MADTTARAEDRPYISPQRAAEIARKLQKTTWGQPPDLSLPVVKLARRIQALQTGRVYAIIVIKSEDGLSWSLIGDGGKVERG